MSSSANPRLTEEHGDLRLRQLASLLDTRDWLTNAAQTCAFIFHELADLNWVGFYLLRDTNELVLGPFQGLPACNPIPLDQGVCGRAARTGQTQRVEDVQAFPGHIVCDIASRSELVVPVVVQSRVWGVLDIDSPSVGRFGRDDQHLIEQFCECFVAASDFD